MQKHWAIVYKVFIGDWLKSTFHCYNRHNFVRVSRSIICFEESVTESCTVIKMILYISAVCRSLIFTFTRIFLHHNRFAIRTRSMISVIFQSSDIINHCTVWFKANIASWKYIIPSLRQKVALFSSRNNSRLLKTIVDIVVIRKKKLTRTISVCKEFSSVIWLTPVHRFNFYYIRIAKQADK